MPVSRGRSARYSFWIKVAAGLGLVVLADLLLFKHRLGANLGGFAFAWLTLTLAVRPELRQDRRARLAAVAAGLAILLLVDRPTLVGWSLCGAALATLALSPRADALPDAWAWARRLALQAVISLAGPEPDMVRLYRLRPQDGTILKRGALAAVLPLGGGLGFLWLFAAANPLIARALALIRFPDLDAASLGRAVFWALVLVMVWATLRPIGRPAGLRPSAHGLGARESSAGGSKAYGLPFVDVRPSSVIAALVAFNALFAIENGLDLTFLWSGARLPAGVTLADYAHRGAYPLIFTALIAAAFSLFVLREGSPSARRPLARRLVGLWIAQNVFLSASSLLRTIDYLQAYSMTRLRIAALLWMGLVMLRLALIGWRMLRGKSAGWLINANALAMVLVLVIADGTDLGAVSAWWNVRHAREVGGPGADLDVCYLHGLGSAALCP